MTQTIKQRLIDLYTLNRQVIDNDIDYPEPFLSETFLPTLQQIESDCESQTGHINIETIVREDGSKFFICDDCDRLVELGNQ